LSIARALLREPSVLILDDALSAVDFQTEEKILTGLKDSRFQHQAQPRTEIIAAHRISSVQDADQIFVLINGEIVQRGTHHELLSRTGPYRQFYDQQRIQEELDAYIQQIEV
jgi:ATP-binding cassette, subfamily B, multidrug efflux pump